MLVTNKENLIEASKKDMPFQHSTHRVAITISYGLHAVRLRR